METVEIVALSALTLSVLLLLKVFSLQRQLNELKSDLRGRSFGPEAHEHSKPNLNGPRFATDITRNSPFANLDERLRLLLASGKRVQAIKEFKKASGLTLKEAKEYVDNSNRGNTERLHFPYSYISVLPYTLNDDDSCVQAVCK